LFRIDTSKRRIKDYNKPAVRLGKKRVFSRARAVLPQGGKRKAEKVCGARSGPGSQALAQAFGQTIFEVLTLHLIYYKNKTSAKYMPIKGPGEIWLSC
jgi:hypothetical protein